jgi:hypothetical protein
MRPLLTLIAILGGGAAIAFMVMAVAIMLAD